MLHYNLRGYLSHIAEATALLRTMASKPSLVMFNETFLTQAIPDIELEGYMLLARRDREGQWGGGVAVFVLTEQFANATVVEISDVAERVWMIIHTNRGPHLVCSWYRPPAPREVGTIQSFESEMDKLVDDVRGVLVVGDINVHSRRWLSFSNGESAEGNAMRDASHRAGLRQIVQAPTRGEYLLDIAMTDIPGASAEVTASIADHKGVLVVVPFAMPEV